MSEIGKLLRLLVQGDKEFKITRFETVGTAKQFTSQLSYARKALYVYNNSDAGSGEILWGGSDVTTNGFPIPVGAVVDIPIAASAAADSSADNIAVYFANSVSGEYGDLRILEVA